MPHFLPQPGQPTIAAPLLNPTPCARSRADQPAELYDVLSAMCSERRALPAAAMQPDEHGCTVLGGWARHRLQLLEHAQWQQSEPSGGQGVASLGLRCLLLIYAS